MQQLPHLGQNIILVYATEGINNIIMAQMTQSHLIIDTVFTRLIQPI